MVHTDYYTKNMCTEVVGTDADTDILHDRCNARAVRPPNANKVSAGNKGLRYRKAPEHSPAFHFVMCVLILNHSSTTVAAKCEAIKAPTCQDMPWNLTHMPNLVHHSSQKNAALVLSQFDNLLAKGCSRYLKFFLCSMFTPMCFHNEGEFPKIVPPCKKICEDARDNCEPVMLKHNVTWPEQLSCDELPEYHRGMCITPDAFIARPNIPECSAANPVKCKKCKRFKVKDKTFAEKKYDFVITAKIDKTIKNACDAIAKVNVTSVLKRRAVEITPGFNILVFNTSCLCPKLKRKREYVLAGYEDIDKGELHLDKESMAEKWGKKWQRRLKKMMKTIPKPRLNRRRRFNDATAPTRKSGADGSPKKKGRRNRRPSRGSAGK